MASIDNFFINSNSISYIPEEKYHEAEKWVKALEAYSRITYQSIYIIDYYKKNFLYVSENPLFLCGHSVEEVKEMGYLFYANYVPKEELEMLIQINKAGFNFYSCLPEKDRDQYTISYNFHLQYDKRKTMINHKLTPIALAADGKIWLAVCAVSLSGYNTAGHVQLRKKGDQEEAWAYSFESRTWEKMQPVVLNVKEKEILFLSAQGYTTQEIADKIFISVNTVKFHKKGIFEKLNVGSMPEAIVLAANYQFL